MDNFNDLNAESLPPGVVADAKPEEEVIITEQNVFTHLESSNWKHRKLSLEFILSINTLDEFFLNQIKSSINTLLADKIAVNKGLALSLFQSYLQQTHKSSPNKDINSNEFLQTITAIIKNKIIADKKLLKTLLEIFEFILDNISLSIEEIQSSIIKPLINELDKKSAMITIGCLRVIWHLYQNYGLDIMPGMITLNKLKNGINSPNKELKELSFNVLLFLSEELNLGSSAIEYVKEKMNLKSNLVKEIDKRYESIKGKEIKRDFKRINITDLDSNDTITDNLKDNINDNNNNNKMIKNINVKMELKDILDTYKKDFIEEYNNCIKWKERIVLIEQLKKICIKNKQVKFMYKNTKLESITVFLINQLINERNSNVICNILELLNLIVINVKEELITMTRKLYTNSFVWFKEKRSSIESNLNSLIDNWFKLVNNKKLEEFMPYTKKYLTDKMPRNRICILNFIIKSCSLLTASIEDDTLTELTQISLSSYNDGNNEVRDLSVDLFNILLKRGKLDIIQKCLNNEKKTNERAVKKFTQISGLSLNDENENNNDYKENTIKYKTIRKLKVSNKINIEEKHFGFIENAKLLTYTKKQLMDEIIKNIDKVKDLKEINEMFTMLNNKTNKTFGTLRGLKSIKSIRPVSNFSTVKKLKSNDTNKERIIFSLQFINQILTYLLKQGNQTKQDLNNENVIEFLNHFKIELNFILFNNNINNMTIITEQTVNLIENINNMTSTDFVITNLDSFYETLNDNVLNAYRFIIQTYSIHKFNTFNHFLTKLLQLNNKEIYTLGSLISYVLSKYVFSYTSNTDGNNYEIDLSPFITQYNIQLNQDVINKNNDHINIKITPFNIVLILNQLSKLNTAKSNKGNNWEIKKEILETINSTLLNNLILLIEDKKDLEELKGYFLFVKECLNDSNKKIVFLALNSLSLFISKSTDLAFFINIIVEMDGLVNCLNDKQQGISEEATKIFVLLIKRSGNLNALNKLISIALSSKVPKKDKIVGILFTFRKLINIEFLQFNLPKFINLIFDKSYKVREFSKILKEHCKEDQFKELVLSIVNKIKKENEKKIILEALSLQNNNINGNTDNNTNINNNNDENKKGKRNNTLSSPIKSPRKTIRRVSMKQTKLIRPIPQPSPSLHSPQKQTSTKASLNPDNNNIDNINIPQNLNISANCIEIGNQTSTCSSSLFLDNIFEIDQKTLIKNEETLLKQIFELKEEIKNKLDLINIYERLNVVSNYIEDACPQIKAHLLSNGIIFKELLKLILKLSCYSLSLNYNNLKTLLLTLNEINNKNNSDTNINKQEGMSFKLYDLLNKLLVQILEENTKHKIEFISGAFNITTLYMFILIQLNSLQYKEYIKVETTNRLLVNISGVILKNSTHLNNVISILFKFNSNTKHNLLELFRLTKYLEIEVSTDITINCLYNYYHLNSLTFTSFLTDLIKFVTIKEEEVNNSVLNNTLKETVVNIIIETKNYKLETLNKLKGICNELTLHKNPQSLVANFYKCLEGNQELFKEATEDLDEVYVNFLIRSIKRIEKSNEMKKKLVKLNQSLFKKEEKNEQINKKEIISLLKKRLFNKKAKVNNIESDNISYPEVKNLIISPKKKQSYSEKINELKTKLKKFDKYK